MALTDFSASFHLSFHHSLRLSVRFAATLACTCMMAMPARAQTSEDVAVRYPAGSIASVESAERALADAAQARALAEAAYLAGKRDCYPKFFTTSCLDDVAEQRRNALARVREVEIEAQTFKRRARVAERDAQNAARPD